MKGENDGSMGPRASHATLPALTPDDGQPSWSSGDPGDTHPTDHQLPVATEVFDAPTDEFNLVSPPSKGSGELMVIPDPHSVRDLDALTRMENAPTVATDPDLTVRMGSSSGFLIGDEESRLRVTGRWEELIELCLQKLESLETPKARAEVFRRIAEVFRDRLEDPEQAVDALVEALAADPFDDGTVDALEALVRAEASWSALVVAVDQAMRGITGDREREVKLCEHLARWHEVERGAPEIAEQYKGRIRQLDPKHPIVQRELADAYIAQGQYALARDALRRAIDVLRRRERVPAYEALGVLFEARLGEPAEAQKAYEAALEIAPTSRVALDGLERVYRALEKYRELESVLDKLSKLDSIAVDDRIGALLRLAELNEKHFLRHDAAAEKLEEVLTMDPGHDGALAALERCQLALRAWGNLTETLDRRAQLARDPSERAEVLFRRAEVEESKLGDFDAAIATYERILRLDGRAALPLSELARLSEKKQDWNAAAAYRAKLASLQPDANAAAQLLVQIGDMLAQPGRDASSARHYYERALTMVPTHVGAWDALRRDAERCGDAERVAHCIEQRARVTESPRVKAQLLVDLARHRASMGEGAAALEAYKEAIVADPSNDVAAAAVLPPLVDEGRWAEAAPLCDLLVNVASRDGDTARTFDLLRLASRVATQLGNAERALTAAVAAYELSPRSIDGRKDLLAALHQCRNDAALVERARAAALRISDDSQDLPVGALVLLADIEQALGLETRAAETLDVALDRAPADAAALRTAAALHEGLGDFARSAALKRRLAEATEEPEARYGLLVETGEMLVHRVKDLPTAAAVFEEALAIKPRDSWLLHTLLWTYGELEAWEKLVDTLRAIEQGHQDPAHKAKCVFTMAQAMRDKIGDPHRAATLFEEAIALDPSRLDAFERVVRIYTELKSWNDLEKSYRRMIHRTPDGAVELRHALFHQLGLIYRDRIGDAERALEAFRAAGALKPSEENRQIVTELHVVTNRVDAAIAETRRALERDPSNAALFGSLYELFLRAQAYDKAWSAVNVLAHLGTLTPEQRKFYDDYLAPPLDRVPGTLTPTAWASHLRHPKLDPTLSTIFGIMAQALTRARFAQLPPERRAATLGEPLRPDHSYNAASLGAAVRNASEILGVTAPALFARKGPPSALAIAPSPTPALSSNVETLDTLSPEALAFLVGKRLAELRPEVIGRAFFPTVTEMTGALATAVRLVGGERTADVATQRADAQVAALMTPEERTALANAVGRATTAGTKLDVKEWSQLADQSSSRVGLLLCGSVESARRAMMQDGQIACDLPLRQRVQQLCIFAVSDQLAELRAAIGIAVR